jgi:hypothetical protein
LDVLNDDAFYRGFPELATYGWLERHSMHVKPQVDVKFPDVLNPNGCTLDGVLLPYEVAFDIKSFGLAAYLANKLVRDLRDDFKINRVKLEGKMDVDTKDVEADALRQEPAIAKELRAGRDYKIPSLGWRISLMQPVPVNRSERSWGPYRQAEELRFYPFKQAAQFTISQPFMLIFAYLPRLNPFLREDETDFTDKFFRSLARRVFIGRENEGTPLSQYDERVKNRPLGDARCLLSALMFVDLESEKYHVFSNPCATNPFPGGMVSFIFNSHPHTDNASYDDFEHDNY